MWGFAWQPLVQRMCHARLAWRIAELTEQTARRPSPGGCKLSDTGGMKFALLALVVSGCVTTAALVKKPEVTLPILIGAAVADVLVVSLAASQVQDLTTGGAIAASQVQEIGRAHV